MARSYTLGEAADILVEGKDVEAVSDLHRRFPMFAHKLMTAMNGDKDAVAEFMHYIPEYVNPRKVEKQITNATGTEEDVEEDVEEEAEQEVPEAPAPKKRTRKAKKEEEPAEEDEPVDEEDNSKYSGKNAMELFKECKKRGIKAAPKKPAKFYIDLLEQADAEAEQADNEDDDEDWDI